MWDHLAPNGFYHLALNGFYYYVSFETKTYVIVGKKYQNLKNSDKWSDYKFKITIYTR